MSRRSEAEPFVRGVEKAGDVGVRNHHALRLPGRTRGIDHIRYVLRNDSRTRIVHDLAVERLFVVEGERDIVALRVFLQPRFLGQKDPRTRIVQHEGASIGWIVGIEGYVTPTRLEDAENSNHDFQRALYVDSDEDVRPDAATLKPVRDSIRTGVEICKGQGAAPRT